MSEQREAACISFVECLVLLGNATCSRRGESSLGRANFSVLLYSTTNRITGITQFLSNSAFRF